MNYEAPYVIFSILPPIFLSNIILVSCYVTAFNLCTSFPARYKNFESHKKRARYKPALFCNASMSMFWFLIIEACSTS
jgi:hypothetical protein